MALSSREDFVMKIAEKIDKDKVDERKDKTEKLSLDKNKLKDLDRAFEKLYEDKLSESISERNFNLMNEKLSKQQEELIEEIDLLEEEIKAIADTEENCEQFVENISKFAKIKELNRYILNQVIDKIYVYDKEEADGEIKHKVEIHYKFIGKLD